MEGKIPINPKEIKMLDQQGKDFIENFPHPDSVSISLLGDEALMMFCAAAITTEVLNSEKNNVWCFIDWCFIDLLTHIKTAAYITGQKLFFDSGPILYRDLSNYDNTDEYRKMGSPLDVYFVKSLLYKNQNEWRVIIVGEKKQLEAIVEMFFIKDVSISV